jgi:hypothetical protein
MFVKVSEAQAAGLSVLALIPVRQSPRLVGGTVLDAAIALTDETRIKIINPKSTNPYKERVIILLSP